MHRSPVRPRLALAAAAVALALTTACSGSSGSGTASPSTTAASSATTASTAKAGPGATPSGSSYATIAALAKALNDAKVSCTLEYAGLKDDVSKVELSICTIDGEQAYLRVWADPTMLSQFLASPDGATGTVAVGSNWTISLGSEKTATKVASAIGGSVPAPSPSGTTP